ncbi:MAG TPA: TIGR04282 family arsenosugar biosynthesis glycosyltransferase [Burkholderiales bacterium]|nr:TIGR04282 family arsenosugar biosynthesis glycosyltransferase [Burkholderiales bacterium]
MAAANDASVLIFARAPVAGNVKTRLIPLLGDHGAAALYRSLVERALSVARGSGVGPVELWCTPTTDDDFFISCRDRFDVALHPQGEGDLGARMLNAFEDALTRSRHVLLTGSDCPSLTPADLRAAARALREGRDAAFGPAEDGGYVLVGLAQAVPALFDAMRWGTTSVMEETRQRLRNLAWHWHELPVHWDVDRPQDYQRLVREGFLTVLDSGGEP